MPFPTFDPHRRRAELSALFAPLDPITTPADLDLALAAIAYASDEHHDDETRLLWARWAYQAVNQLRVPTDPDAIMISSCYQQVLSSQGLTVDAVTVCAARLHAVEASGERSMSTRHSLALALHADGQCADAHRQMAAAVRDRAGSDRLPQLIVLLAQARLFAGCGMARTAVRMLYRHREQFSFLGTDLVDIAEDLTAIEISHPRQGCEQRIPGPGNAEQRLSFWRQHLNAILTADQHEARR
uniref:hypothetical protein n=1 Tax=Paractinoplanes polyasparticus TaxID=2856853 RepID=UPI001C842B89|nr:hypothetical protein [Actinoplanes polyasparticus]